MTMAGDGAPVAAPAVNLTTVNVQVEYQGPER